MKYYAGIGSRETPEDIREKIHDLANTLQDMGYILRSGGAEGADTFFEESVLEKEIYIPWKNFNGSISELYEVCDDAIKLAEHYHPAWERVKQGGRKCLSRNVYQVLGKDLETPVEFIVCWTKGGKKVGGTAQAMRIAEDLDIPIFNLYHGFDAIYEHIEK